MKILIVYAHPEPHSFNASLKNIAEQTLLEQGHQLQISDLYAMNWKATIDQDDFHHRQNNNFLNISTEQEHHHQTDHTSPDIKSEQNKVLWCDVLIFQFPIWWFGMPAILKGWVDRVMSRGFAYARGKKYDTGIFKGRKAMICATTGTASSLYEPDGIDGDIMHLLWPIHNGIFRYLGFDVLPPYIAWMPGNVSDQERQEYLLTYREKLLQIDQIPTLFFHPKSDYGSDQRLKADVIAKTGFQWNPRAKQTHDKAADKYTKR